MFNPLINIPPKHATAFACFLVLYEFLAYISNDMIMPGMISVIQSFKAPESTIATSLTFFVLGGASLQLLLGPLSDIYGRRRIMLLGVSSFFIFTLLIACSHSINQFLAGRFFQGMGLCFIGVIGYSTIQEIFDEMDAIRLIAIMANATVLAPLLGPLLGAIVIHYASWRYIFFSISFLVLIALWGLWRFMPEPVGQVKKDGKIIPKNASSFKLVITNYKTLITNPSFCYGILALGVLGIPFIAWIALAPVLLITEAQLTVIQYGLCQLPLFGATALGNWCLNRLTYSYSKTQIILAGCFLLIIGMGLLSLLPFLFGNHYYLLFPGLLIYLFSLSILAAPINRFCLFATSVSKGTAAALISLSTMVMGAMGIELANIFYRTHNNLYFALFCNGLGFLFLILIGLTYLSHSEKRMDKKIKRDMGIKTTQLNKQYVEAKNI